MKKYFLLLFFTISCFAGRAQCNVTIVTIGPGILCYGDCNGDLQAAATGTAPFTYQWSTGDTSSLLSGMCPGTYIVTATDSVGCVSTATITLTEPPPLTAIVTADYSNCTCTYEITASGGIPGYTYQWCDGSFSPQMVN